MKSFNYSISVVCGKCVAEKIEAGQHYGVEDVVMDFEWSEDGSCLFATCDRGHDTRVEVHYSLDEKEVREW